MNNIKRISSATLLVFIVSVQKFTFQEINEEIEPACEENSVKYSIYNSLKKFLENENNIDGRELYS